jgi:hypothetical protein
MDSTAPAPTGIGTELASARFADVREVGRGTVGLVYRCHHTSLQRAVAVKVSASNAETRSGKRFLRAGCVMGALSGHPNIVTVVQVGVTETNRPYIVMPYYAAGSLDLRLRQVGPVPWSEAVRIGVTLCGALETAHRAGTLHGGIKPANVLMNDDGEPQLSDFGMADAAGGDEAARGFFTDALVWTAPEVLAGHSPTVAADIYALGATLYAIVAGRAPRDTADLIAHYLRINAAPIPDLRTRGIPASVCASIETALSLDPAGRHPSAAELCRELQTKQLHQRGPAPQSTALGGPGEADDAVGMAAVPDAAAAASRDLSTGTAVAPGERVGGPATVAVTPAQVPEALVPSRTKRRRKPIVRAAAAAIVMALVVPGGVYYALVSLVPREHSYLATRDSDGTTSAPEPATQAPTSGAPTVAAPVVWQPITSGPPRAALTASQANGAIGVFGGVGSDGIVSGRCEWYDPAVDAWKAGDDLPVPVLHAMSVTWQGTPVVLGGWRSDGGVGMVATERVWRLVDGRWVELPPMLQPRTAGAAAVVGGRIIVTGGVDANGVLLKTTEIYDGSSWTLGADLPTPRLMLEAASDDNAVYVVGGIIGRSDLGSVEAFDPFANTWTALPELPQARSDLGVAISDGRLLAVGGMSSGQVLKSVAALDLSTLTWSRLPDMGTARHGMALAVVANSVYAIGGSTGSDDREATSSAEVLNVPPRNAQPA